MEKRTLSKEGMANEISLRDIEVPSYYYCSFYLFILVTRKIIFFQFQFFQFQFQFIFPFNLKIQNL